MSKYVKLTDIEHVLARPGMYIGSIIPETSKQWLLNETDNQQKIIQRRYRKNL